MARLWVHVWCWFWVYVGLRTCGLFIVVCMRLIFVLWGLRLGSYVTLGLHWGLHGAVQGSLEAPTFPSRRLQGSGPRGDMGRAGIVQPLHLPVSDLALIVV